jgi:hypothetical protein
MASRTAEFASWIPQPLSDPTRFLALAIADRDHDIGLLSDDLGPLVTKLLDNAGLGSAAKGVSDF